MTHKRVLTNSHAGFGVGHAQKSVTHKTGRKPPRSFIHAGFRVGHGKQPK